MFSRLFIAILGFAIALCQAGSDGSYQPTPQHFKYWGCATVDAAGFSTPVPLPNGVLTPEMCKAACAYHMFAAVSPGACRCGDNPNAIKTINEGFCNNPCNESPNSPMCGGGCPEDGDTGISNLFVIQPAIIQPAGPQVEPSNQRNQLEPSTVLVPVSTLVESFASAALPWQTSSPPMAPTFPPGQAPVPSSSATGQGPPQSGSLLPSSGFVPVDPPTTAVGRVMATITSTVHVQPSLTWPDDEPPSTPGTPVVDPVSVSEGTGVVSASASESSLAGETLFTDSDPVPTSSSAVTEVPMSEANHFEIKLLVTLTELLLIAVVLV